MAKDAKQYPKPKKGERVKCLGCKDGKVMGPRGVIRNCKSCKGNGFIVAK